MHQLNRWIEARGSSVLTATHKAAGVMKGDIAEVFGSALPRMLVRQRISAGLSQNFCEALSRAALFIPSGNGYVLDHGPLDKAVHFLFSPLRLGKSPESERK